MWTAAWPFVRVDLGLSYVQVGVLLSAPHVVGNLVEPALGILGDTRSRHALIRAGGVAFAAGLGLIALGDGFALLLAALALLSPAAGAFVGLSQASLMDLDPGRRERRMAQWALAGSLGSVAGPLVVASTSALGLGWRAAFASLTVPAVLALALVWRARLTPPVEQLVSAAPRSHERPLGAVLARGARDVLRALGRREVVRWLALLELADLMLDVLHGYLALYLVDVAGVSGGRAGLAVLVWTGVGLLGDALLIPLLERVSGTRYLRASALAVLALFPAFLLVPGTAPKLVILGALGLLNAGWYAILKARLYAELPGRSAAVLAIGNVSGLAGSLLPLGVGLAAERYGLGAAMWLLLLAPVALLVGIPRRAAGVAAG